MGKKLDILSATPLRTANVLQRRGGWRHAASCRLQATLEMREQPDRNAGKPVTLDHHRDTMAAVPATSHNAAAHVDFFCASPRIKESQRLACVKISDRAGQA